MYASKEIKAIGAMTWADICLSTIANRIINGEWLVLEEHERLRKALEDQGVEVKVEGGGATASAVVAEG